MRALPQPRRGVRAEGPQAVLSLAGLRLRQVHAHRRAPAGHGCTGERQTHLEISSTFLKLHARKEFPDVEQDITQLLSHEENR